jgi:hypothetical protein
MPNQFSVTPLGGFDVGGAAMGHAQDYRQRQAADAKKEMFGKASSIFNEGTADEQAAFMIQNPEVREAFVAVEKFKNDKTKGARTGGARRILTDEDPELVLDDIAQAITNEGGDPSDILAFKGRSPEEIKKAAFQQLAILDPKAAQAFAQTQTEKAGGFTLSEGQARFDDAGNVIAYHPKTISTLENDLKASKDKFDRASKMRGEVEKVSKVYRDVEDAYGRIEAAADDKSGAADMALIFNYMKMLDPGSTVREGEFATAAKTGGLPAYIQNIYNKTKDGRFISGKQRKDFVRQAKAQFKTATNKQNKRLAAYEKLGKRYDLERGDIIVSETEKIAEDQNTFPSAPAVGAVVEGWTYKGGDPADPNSWSQ